MSINDVNTGELPLPTIDLAAVSKRVGQDVELAYQMRGLAATIRISLPDVSFDFKFDNGSVSTSRSQPGTGTCDAEIVAGEDFWKCALRAGVPAPGYESLTMGGLKGLSTRGDFLRVIAPYQMGLQRLYRIFVEAVVGPLPRKAEFVPNRATDTAVGRYRYIRANDTEARVYYEEAGHGSIPLLLHATAGADSRQYRNVLADPEMQARFRMYAYDLPYHGRSLPPIGVRWWERAYKPTLEYLMNWVVAFADALELDQPFFMGCSVGGQLALDLAAERPERFGAFVSLNGMYDPSSRVADATLNDRFRTPSISSYLAPGMNFGATSPVGPESSAYEIQWIYHSGYPGIYAGDNDYYLVGHDLKRNGHKLRAVTKPVYLVAGEYDPAAFDQDHGGIAVKKNIPNVEFIVAPGLSHFAMTDDPQGFSTAIVPILDRVIAQTRKK